jgi:transcription initiation factor TFIIIB Brf1 subunit/transcription initiation factor TFIIB
MSITAACDACGSKFKVADQYAGRKGKCKKCGGVVTIPQPAPEPEADLYDLAEPDPIRSTATAVAPIAPIAPVAASRVAPIAQPRPNQPLPGNWAAATPARATQSDPTWLLRILKLIGGVICLVGGLAFAGYCIKELLDENSTMRRPFKGISAGVFLVILGAGLIIKAINNSDE